ncbi:hypothetical protein [Halocella sp. SP3-1]|uniref:hypothetical protein n=1 Tax=Halocella sp. SP3-1 TaxID=2382161 RepID=UPI000F74C8E0|nr:hypothetical protein [Halocella sp. SP3-1]AZO95249.1 hypothetical protein D7D81_11980 [Halocella sp. SP3-1]
MYYGDCEFCEADFKDEQAEEIRKYLADMANEKVEFIIADYEHWKSQYKELIKQNKDLRAEVSKLKFEKNEDLEKYTIELQKVIDNQKNKEELRKELVNNFVPGEKVYWIIKDDKYKDCAECNGTGYVKADYKNSKHDIRCPKCKDSGYWGKGKILTKRNYKIESNYIKQIHFNISMCKDTKDDFIIRNVKAYIKCEEYPKRLDELYHTKEDAEKAIEKMKEEDNND